MTVNADNSNIIFCVQIEKSTVKCYDDFAVNEAYVLKLVNAMSL